MILILKNIIIEAEKLSKIIEEINFLYGEEISIQYKKLIFDLFLKIAYISGIADKEFVHQEKVVIQYYFWIIFDNRKKEEILKLKSILEDEKLFNKEYNTIKEESDKFFKENILQFEKDKDLKIENLFELEKIKEIDTLNNFMFYQKIINSLYRLASYIVKADGEVNKDEVKCLKSLWEKLYFINTSDVSNESIKNNQILEFLDNLSNISQNNLEKNLEELNKLIGLKSVKDEINSIINFIKVKKLREEKQIKSSDITLHSIFFGNPGTGKTLVARLLGQIFKDIGLLSKGHLIEADRSKFVADFIGQTSSKTDNLIESALGGILFIDEAYALISQKTENDFGHEAVSILLKRMEDHRKDFIVICAGYPDEMKNFLEANPGLKSRFNIYLNFPDYNPKELLEIFEFFCNKLEYSLTKEAKEKALRIITEEYNKKDKYFGNARLSRNLFESTIKNHSSRIAEIAPITKEILTYITDIDIPNKLDNL